tara:strand:+ start:141 stop:326 length:186 start_codon:yes stop_codon:yes gene_type:complete
MSKNTIKTSIDLAKSKYDEMQDEIITQCKERLKEIAMAYKVLTSEEDRILRYLEDLTNKKS